MAQIRIPYAVHAVLTHMAKTLEINEDELLYAFESYIEDIASKKVDEHENDNIHETNRYYSGTY
jgi:hypothetical protein